MTDPLRESDRQSSESRDWGSASALEVEETQSVAGGPCRSLGNTGRGTAGETLSYPPATPHWEIGVLIGPCDQEDAEWLTELVFDVAQGRLGAVASLHRIADIEAWSKPLESPHKWIPAATKPEASPSPESESENV